MKKYWPLIIILVYFTIQLPFLSADPDTLVDTYSRGPWTDEGGYVSQVKNLVNHHHFDINETDCFVLAPFYNILMAPAFFIFGTKLIVGRLVTLFLSLGAVSLFLLNRKFRHFGIFLSLFVMLEFHIFQFAHYALAEVVCLSLLLFSFYFFLIACQAKEYRKKIRLIFVSVFFSFLCYFTKISFTYVIGLVPITAFIIAIRESIIKRKFDFRDYRFPCHVLLITVALFGIYFLCWCLPNMDRIRYVLSRLTTGFYASTVKMVLVDAWYIFINKFWTNIFRINLIHFLVFIFFTTVFFTIKKIKFKNVPLLIFSSVWLLFELTRMPLHYLPYRYLLGFIFASGAILSTVYSEWTYHYGKLQYLFFTLAIIIAFFNLKNNYDAYNRRTFQLGAINNYLADYNLKDKPVLGSWASTVCWKNKAIVLPVWYKYYNWIDPIKKFNPALVVTELDESDSNEAYKNEGIDLNKISDSCRVFDVWNYKLVLYWIKSMKEIRPN